MTLLRPAAALPDHWAFTAPFEGVVPHQYLDTRRIITAGVGFALPTERSVATLAWDDLEVALVDWRLLQQSSRPAGMRASYYRSVTRATLPEAAMRSAFESRVADFRAAMRDDWRLDALLAPAQLALVDMAYNLGVAGLRRYEDLRAAVRAGDWQTAASECHRRGVQIKRNAATAELFLMCSVV